MRIYFPTIKNRYFGLHAEMASSLIRCKSFCIQLSLLEARLDVGWKWRSSIYERLSPLFEVATGSHELASMDDYCHG